MQRFLEEAMAKIILAGATGLTGSQLLPMLSAQGDEVTVITRRAIDDLSDGVDQLVVPPEEWPQTISKMQFDVGISCLGSTIKKAGSQEAFRNIDYKLLRDFAAATKQAGVQHFMAVSSSMADSSASSFYLKTKGEAEDALRVIGFDRLDIIQPGLLKGPRQEFRMGERAGIMLSPLLDILLIGKMRKFRSIEAADVARALAILVSQRQKGDYVHRNPEIWKLATK